MLGWFHHLHFLKYGKRGPVSYGHLWYGRTLMVLGVVNGGLGLQLSSEDSTLTTPYIVVVCIMFAAYVAVKAFRKLSGPKATPAQDVPLATDAELKSSGYKQASFNDQSPVFEQAPGSGRAPATGRSPMSGSAPATGATPMLGSQPQPTPTSGRQSGYR